MIRGDLYVESIFKNTAHFREDLVEIIFLGKRKKAAFGRIHLSKAA